ncbi:MAG: hypothetical protein WCJ01_05035 [Ignavibacteria bacterium]
MNQGTEILKKILEEMKSISTEEYLELHEIASQREPVVILTNYDIERFWGTPSGELNNSTTANFFMDESSGLPDYKNSLPFSSSNNDITVLAA